jgi:hypothetical protein
MLPIRLNPGQDLRRALESAVLDAGCTVRTTTEVLRAMLPDWDFVREPDTATGFDELVARRKDIRFTDDGAEAASAP